MKTRFTGYNVESMTEQVLRPTTGSGASGDAHCHAAAYERLHDRSDSFDVSLQNLLSVLGDKLSTHHSKVGCIITVVFVLQFVRELPVLNSCELGNNVGTASRQ